MSVFGGFGASAQKPVGGSLFGQTQQQPAQQNAGGGLFGATQGNTSTGFGGGFGQQNQNQNAQNTQQPGSTFGGNTLNSSTLGGSNLLFGQQQQNQGGHSLFGQPQQNQQNQQGLSLFGNPQQQQNPNQQQGSMFGQSQQQQQQRPMGNNLFGLSNGNFNQSQNNSMQQSQMNQNQNGGQGQIVLAQLQRIARAWDVNDPTCQFHTYLYNQAPDEVQANQFDAGPNEDKQKFDAAVRRKPNPKAFPVLARGFDDLQHRMGQQEQQIVYYRAMLHGINNKLDELAQTHDLYTTIRFQEALAKHQQLAHRTLALTAKVQVLKHRGYALQPEEESLRKRLETLAKTIQDPGVIGRVNEIWARMTVVREKARQMESEVNELGSTVDPEQIQKMALVLQSHEKGIQGLRAEVSHIEKAFSAWEKEKAERIGGGR